MEFDRYLSGDADVVSRLLKGSVLDSVKMRGSLVDFSCELPAAAAVRTKAQYGTTFRTLLALRRILDVSRLSKRARNREALDSRFLMTMHWIRKYPTEQNGELRWNVTEKVYREWIREIIAALDDALPKVHWPPCKPRCTRKSD